MFTFFEKSTTSYETKDIIPIVQPLEALVDVKFSTELECFLTLLDPLLLIEVGMMGALTMQCPCVS